MHAALAILRKDLDIEWRTREGLSTVFVLAVMLLVVFAVAHDLPPDEAPALAPPVLWATFVLTGLLGVQRGFLLERENDCLAGLLTAPVDPASIYAGKFAANVVVLGAMIFLYFLMQGIILSGQNPPGDEQILSRIWIAGVIPFFIGIALIVNGLSVRAQWYPPHE